MSNRSPDRRQMPRHTTIEQHGIVLVRIRPGHRAHMIDVSAAGALLETTHRLLPGTNVELHMENATERANVRARVIRCCVVRLRAAGVCYQGAVAFDRHLPWFVDRNGYSLPTTDHRDGRRARADVTRDVV